MVEISVCAPSLFGKSLRDHINLGSTLSVRLNPKLFLQMIFLFKKITDHFIEYRNIPNWRCYGGYWKINQRSVRCLTKEVRLTPFSELAFPSFHVKLNNINTLLLGVGSKPKLGTQQGWGVLYRL
ncbi:hypothetical protein GIB67_006687 [Kingdonia uniflora]|uniref:Uncharacterized protein n=1 Tax=Kingdonia uniflora TaxID=39325 RepID=A0A7J7LB10_9MAGN|nr:hypothetical protein GIB67_006687 [Kingdonia uniflora]